MKKKAKQEEHSITKKFFHTTLDKASQTIKKSEKEESQAQTHCLTLDI